MVIQTMPRSALLWLGAALVGASSGCVSSAQVNDPITLRPGQDIQGIVASSSEGAQFVFEPGVYRQQTIFPKNRQTFTGQDGVILNGAMQLTTWTKLSGFWQADGLPEPLWFHGACREGRELCSRREDLFLNGRVYDRSRSLHELGPGRWYYENGRAYLADDPTGHFVELSVTPLAFGGNAEDVVLKDLIVEKYASDAQKGAIYADDARGWLISNVTARWNHGAGLSFGPETHVQGGFYGHNGQLGIGGEGEGSRIEGVEIAFNNYAGYDPDWEAGGTKFWETKDLIVRSSCIHHNEGPGLWTDTDNIDTLYEDNKVFLNTGDGIKHEVSNAAIIRNNVVTRNGMNRVDEWLWGAQILVQNSQNVAIHDNVVEVSGEFGNGIGVIHQERGAGAYGPWNGVNNTVYQNTVVHLGDGGRNGVVTDTNDDWFWNEANNKFDRNRYIVADRSNEYWSSNDREMAWNEVKGLGLERNGELKVEQRAPMKLSCGAEAAALSGWAEHHTLDQILANH